MATFVGHATWRTSSSLVRHVSRHVVSLLSSLPNPRELYGACVDIVTEKTPPQSTSARSVAHADYATPDISRGRYRSRRATLSVNFYSPSMDILNSTLIREIDYWLSLGVTTMYALTREADREGCAVFGLSGFIAYSWKPNTFHAAHEDQNNNIEIIKIKDRLLSNDQKPKLQIVFSRNKRYLFYPLRTSIES